MKILMKIIFISCVLSICMGCTNQIDKNNQSSNQNSVSESKIKLKSSVSGAEITAIEATEALASANKTDKKVNKPLEGLTVCVDAGHGITARKSIKEPIAPGTDIMKTAIASGTRGVSTNETEEKINLKVSIKLKKKLSDKGAKIVMVRESDRCDLTNVERAKFWNSSCADITVRIHCNGINNSKVSGILMMIPGEKYIKDEGILGRSSKAGQYILDGVLKYTKARSRGILKSNEMTGFNWSQIPVVLLEMGFMTNPAEDILLNTDQYQEKIVEGITEGLERYNKELKSKGK